MKISKKIKNKNFSKFDVVDYLKTEKDIAGYLSAVLEDGDPALFVAAIGDIAKAKGMTEIAKKSGVTRESLYRALKIEARPRFETVAKVVHALGMKLSVHA
ncbi:putative addiction module antidote protein [Polynucleobacter sp. TSB-Sco08W16]|uniref:addiction module antidote protein n=1 Tax=Polynucleobacter sp. TSB-Sco08W16 TaxID=1758374 RepID=UPI001BFD025E|nr:addiction module antidote protein [Polynucleobacter sp. TSB-Sco08W16]QWD74529.1 putative addiction module antidote protein [Polynucleobacter sp. TSB-Sco08W16]